MSAPGFDLDPTQPDLRRSDVSVFEGRLPDPAEILQWGGKPGVEYLIIDAANLHQALALPPVELPDGTKDKWTSVKDVNVYQVSGPKGVVTVMILGRGKPIPGADPANGIRKWSYDRSILTSTGLKSPYGGTEGAQEDKPPALKKSVQGQGKEDPESR